MTATAAADDTEQWVANARSAERRGDQSKDPEARDWWYARAGWALGRMYVELGLGGGWVDGTGTGEGGR